MRQEVDWILRQEELEILGLIYVREILGFWEVMIVKEWISKEQEFGVMVELWGIVNDLVS
jgi:hypothetical protein